MSDFSDAFADAFDAATSVFGGAASCVIAGLTFDCVLHDFDREERIGNGMTAGRQAPSSGVAYLKAADWTTAKARLLLNGRKTGKGAQVTVAGSTFRILNDPDVGYESDTVELRLGPLTT